MKIITSLKSVEYCEPGEPEKPERISETYGFLKEKGYELIEPDLCSEKDILRIHSADLIEAIKTLGKKHRDLLAYDIKIYKNIFYYASLSAGAAIKSMEMCLNGEKTFSLMRPPGHHAGKIAEGFCFFNNMAIAVAKAIAEKKVKKVTILDIDLHHGNGT